MPALVFWDFVAAFPSVSQAWLFTVLAAAGFPEGFLRLVHGIYFMNFAYGTDGTSHRFLFQILSGVVQGCPLSGLLFAVLLDPFLRAISSLIDDKGDAVTR
eukprot:10499933-Heterocapsa_arctica.AAC.1